jgi:hypothetical protein
MSSKKRDLADVTKPQLKLWRLPGLLGVGGLNAITCPLPRKRWQREMCCGRGGDVIREARLE